MMRRVIFLSLILVATIPGCTKEDPYEKEQKEIDAYFSTSILNIYKAFKVSVRGTKAVGQDTAFDRARRQLFSLTGYILQQAADSTHPIEVTELASNIAEVKPAIDELLKKDEDSLPTVLDNIVYVSQTSSDSDALTNLLTESEEHLVLSGLWFAGAHAHPDLALYEMSRVNTNDIRMVQFRCVAEMCRSILYLNNNWPYHAEKSADDLLSLTDSLKEKLMKNPWPAIDANGNAVTPEQALHQLRAISFLLRGAAREECDDADKKEQATDDLGEFVKEAQAGGLDHEVVDLAGLIVALEKENNADALTCIGKLENRPNLTQDEKDVIADVKKYVNDKNEDDAEDAIYKGNLVSSFAENLFACQFMNLPVVQQLHSSEAGKAFIAITEIKAESVLPGASTIDSLKQDAEGLIDKVIH